MNLPESDWRLLKSVHRTALDRYCSRVLEKSAETIGGEGSAHDRYLRLYRLLKDRDRNLAAAFDDLRRSTAIQRLAAMIALEVVSEEELAQFSAGTQDSAKLLSGL